MLTVPAGLNSLPKADRHARFHAEKENFSAKEIFNLKPDVERKYSFRQITPAAAKQFVVRRDSGKTIIAGYSVVSRWGRDSLICARDFLVRRMIRSETTLLTFAN